MPVSAAERRFVLDNLTRLAEADIRKMWRVAELQTDLEFAAYVTQAFPEIVDPYHQMAAQAGATFFEEDFPEITTPPVVAPPLPTEQLTNSAGWALAADGVEAISRMAGTTQRAIYDGERDTTAANASENGMRWVRVARPDACAFCKLLASRTTTGTTYSSSGVRKKIDPTTGKPFADGRMTTAVYGRRRTGSKRKTNAEYHDHCHCTAKAIPSGRDPMDYLSATEPQFAELAQQWDDQYQKARADAGTGDAKAILKSWRQQDGVEVYTPKAKADAANLFDRAVLDNADSVDAVAKYINGKHGINTEGLAKPLFANGMPMEESLKRGADSISAYQASLPRVITVESGREFGQAVDDIMTKYPYLKLEEIKGDFLPYGNPLASAAHCAPKLDKDYNSVGYAESVVLNALSDVVGSEGKSYAARARFMLFEDSRYAFDARDRPVYAVMVHEMGHVVDFNGGCLARNGRVQKSLCEYIATLPGAPKLDRKRVFDLYTDFNDFEREWLRENLTSAYSFEDGDRTKGVFWAEALAEAFADVELRGESAEVASKIIHREMISAAEESKLGKRK